MFHVSEESKQRRQRRSFTDEFKAEASESEQPLAPNLLGRPFESDGPNQRWVGDTTELVTPSGKL